ncbi:MAG: hypothetical protein F4Y26_00560 [Gammaproteobacteria bacterium]|nr:hypothetical protein [Gammaproteobacteria bacterium]
MNHVVTYEKEPKAIAAAIEPGGNLMGLTDGRFSKIDLVLAIAEHLAPVKRVTISTWCAAQKDIRASRDLLDSPAIGDMRWVVDKSFLARQPEYVKDIMARFGTHAIRVWMCHSKFVIFTGAAGDRDTLLLTSMNLKTNRRIENFQLITHGPTVQAYDELVTDIYRIQEPGEALEHPKRIPGQTQRALETREQRLERVWKLHREKHG